ncbi:helix-turn-helix domain-containing protein [Sinosporangium siamense]|uniref:DNA-binding protein n=1 Tax=Sinosporangium siamense TaxID=1367973 RepID=A0A919V6J5_9ACTN|nr:helix-turn-helix transcriptional regulator [Sinosporangium siamense]GII92071.1 DNA-binding protein [Sinosporangium siamense]
MNSSLRRELGAHLRAAREQVAPAEVGLVGGERRRTPGLRREEVAALAGVSVAWYTWLEQGRATTTRQVIDALCRVLRMDSAAHRHTLALAGFLPLAPLNGTRAERIGQETRLLVDSWTTTPAAIVNERFDIAGGNAAHSRLWGDPALIPEEHRNVLLWLATPADDRPAVAEPEPLLRGLYEQFRANTAHVPDDPRTAEIVHLLTTQRPDVSHWWRCRAVQDFTPVTVEVTIPSRASSRLRLSFSLLRPVAEQGIYILSQAPGDDHSREALAGILSTA